MRTYELCVPVLVDGPAGWGFTRVRGVYVERAFRSLEQVVKHLR
jgi:hypothetical protein